MGAQRARRRIAVLAEGAFTVEDAKTAVGVIRYGRDAVVAVLDSASAGRTAGEVIGVGGSIPIVATMDEALAHAPDTLLIGIAPRGGGLPPAWRAAILGAIQAGLDVYNGLHHFFADDPEFAAAARARGVRLWDVRRPPDARLIATAEDHRPGSRTVLTVGTDCNVGKMTAALELEAEAARRGLSRTFVATGQTGILIWGDGVPLDRVISDFVAGTIEAPVLAACAERAWVFVEGQGSLFHPAYSGVTLGLMHGAAPEAMILCHQPTRRRIRGYAIEQPDLPASVAAYEQAANWRRPARVAAIALNTYDLDDAAARAAVAEATAATGLPATDPVRFGAGLLLDALLGLG
jgi:uncharacterized NAD-dependent epimerase/dehydratase family protein